MFKLGEPIKSNTQIINGRFDFIFIKTFAKN